MNWPQVTRLFRPWGPRRETGCLAPSEISLEIVEEGIWPLVQALNQIDGVRTIASCHGHRGWSLVSYSGKPYVFFEGPGGLALALSEQIDRAHSRRALIYEWKVGGLTHPELGMCIYLSIKSRFFLRWKLARDLAWLSEYVASQARHGSDAVVGYEPLHRHEQNKSANQGNPPLSLEVAEQIISSAPRTLDRDSGGQEPATASCSTESTLLATEFEHTGEAAQAATHPIRDRLLRSGCGGRT
ncbi:hypothetical protein [Burkholderia glumae]|uniref:hypothetical protein n=1 Tax=Burkholderia glumae TaxID=337 RepID=UPI00156E71AA|nr:hypothetical protein [Burkholderia glumae]QKM57781.1 hypothetical protein CG017_05861 [Burkholderia glumae]